MIPNKALPAFVCEKCGKRPEEEMYEVNHVKHGRMNTSVFCSLACWQEFMEVLPTEELERRYNQETNELYKQVCPACKQRFRERTIKNIYGD